LIIVVIQLRVRSRLFQLIDEVSVPPPPHQLDISRLSRGAHGERARILVAGRVLHFHVEAAKRSTPLCVDERLSRCAGLLLQENGCTFGSEVSVGLGRLCLELFDVKGTSLDPQYVDY
jgi:hypothetical protein